MPQNNPLPPNIPGTTADDQVYLIREGEVPRLKALYPLYILGAGAVMAVISMATAGWLTLGGQELDGDDRQKQYVQALAVAAIGGGASATLLGIGSTALQIGGDRREQLPSHYYPAQSMALPMVQEGDRFALDPEQPAGEGFEPVPREPSQEAVGFLRGQVLPGEQSDYDARLAEVDIDRIQAEVANILDGFQTNDRSLWPRSNADSRSVR